jgi:predicted Zn-dependent protease
LTRRGRLAVLTVSVVAVLGLAFAAASASIANDHPEQTRVVVVTPGQTLWDISSSAAAATGSGDVRSMMSHIEAINHLDSASLQAGQHLRIPR